MSLKSRLPLFWGGGYHVFGIFGNLEISGIRFRSVKVRTRLKVRKRPTNLCRQGNLIVAAQESAGNETVVW